MKESSIAGKLSAHGSEHALEGDFANGTLTLATPSDDGDRRLSLKAKLKSDGTIAREFVRTYG